MLKTVLIALSLASIATAFPSSPAQIFLSRIAPITPLALGGFTDCGVARLIDVRFNGCANAPCQVNRGSQISLSIDFTPREMHWDLTHRAIVLKEAELAVLSEGQIPDSTVWDGQTYTFNYNWAVPQQFTGESELRLKVYQNYVHELCMIIPLNIN